MSVSTSLRTFLVGIHGHSFGQISQQFIPETFNPALGYICYSRRSTTRNRTMEESGAPNDIQMFDVEVYHPDIDRTEAFSELLESRDGYRGDFGSGHIQAMFVVGQADDYVPMVDMTSTENMASSFLSLEVRSYQET